MLMGVNTMASKQLHTPCILGMIFCTKDKQESRNAQVCNIYSNFP